MSDTAGGSGAAGDEVGSFNDFGDTIWITSPGFQQNYRSITSPAGWVQITSTVKMDHVYQLLGNIYDYPGVSVDIDISALSNAFTNIEMEGGVSNTYTGYTNVNANTEINLIKRDGITAISGSRLNLIDGGSTEIFSDEQIANKTRVLLESYGFERSTIAFNGRFRRDITETVGELAVLGKGVVNFEAEIPGTHGGRWFYMDDLNIAEGALLTVRNWEEGRDFFLVRKDSAHLQESLKRLDFEGYDRKNIHLQDFGVNKDYWAVSSSPEPATYGAVLGACGLGLVALKSLRTRRLRENRAHSRSAKQARRI